MLCSRFCLAVLAGMLLLAALLVRPLVLTHADLPSTPSVAIVEIRSDGFHPQNLKIKTGTSVKWVNKDTKPHSVGGELRSPLSAPFMFGTSAISPGRDTGPISFDVVGEVYYKAQDHPKWTGTITVSK
jgi:plastocyanin